MNAVFAIWVGNLVAGRIGRLFNQIVQALAVIN